MLYEGDKIVRNFISESNSRVLANKYNDTSFRSTDLGIIREAYNRIPLNSSLLREYSLDQNDIMALQIIAEQSGQDHEIILLEFFGAIKKLGKKIGAAIASPFKAVAKAKKGRDQGASWWQSVKYGMTALPQLFKHGTHFGQGEATEKAKKAYAKILSDFESASNKRLKELTKAAKELGQTDFPNNAKPEDFRMMLMGKENFADVESGGLGGLLGMMLEIREAQQQYVDQGGDIKRANQIIERMRKMLQFFMGEMHDTYQSLESKDRHGRPIIRGANQFSLLDHYYDSTYWYNKVCEGMYDTLGNIITESLNEDVMVPEEKIVDAPKMSTKEDTQAFQKAIDGKDEKELMGLFSDEGLEGLDSKNLDSMRAASSTLRPILIACLGAAMVALGVSQGGSPIGDFENSDAVATMLKNLEGTRVTEIPGKMTEEITTYFSSFSVEPDEGLTQFVARVGNLSKEAVRGMSGPQFLAKCKELGINPENMKGILENSKEAFSSLESMEGTMGGLGSKIGNGSIPGDPFNMSLGSVGVKKKLAQTVLKQATKITVKTFASGAVSSAIAGAALPTVLATAGVGIAASGLAVAALRKFAKNRKKTMDAAIKLLHDIKGASPVAPVTNPDFINDDEDGGGDGGPIPKPEKPVPVQSLDSQLPLDLFKRSIKDKGYEKEDELADEIFKDPTAISSLVQDTPPKPGTLTAGYRRELNQMSETIQRWNRLAGLLTENMEWDDFVPNIQRVAKDAGLPIPNEEQLGYGAQALNVTRGIGDINNMPGPFKKEEFENKINDLTIIIENLKLENSEAVRGMLDKLAMKVGLDPKNYADLENDKYMEKLGETWNNDQEAWEDAMEEIEDLKGQLAAAHAKLDEKEAELAQSIAKIDELVDDNGQLVSKNKKLKGKLKKLKGKLEKKNIKIDDLKSTLKDKDKLLKLGDKEKSELQKLLDDATSELTGLKDREAELSSRVLDLRKFYLALSKVSGSNKTTYNTKDNNKKRTGNIDKMAKAFTSLGNEFPALKDTGEILQRSLDANVNTSVAGSGQLKKGGGRNEPGARSKKEETSWRKGDLIMEKLNILLENGRTSYGSTPVESFPEGMGYVEMLEEMNYIFDELSGGSVRLMDPEDYARLLSFMYDAAEDGEEDAEYYLEKLTANQQGQYVRIAMR